MPRLTDQGLQRINDLAQHYGVSADAVMTLLQALLNSKGTMAQFDHRELGGAGQWMPGGMTMVGDMPTPEGKSIKSLITITHNDANTKVVSIKGKMDGKEVEMVEITYKRRAKLTDCGAGL